jgi:hypothetical protein
MTNLDKLRGMTAEELAPLLVKQQTEDDWDEDVDGDWKCIGTEYFYMSPCSDYSYLSEEEAIAETIQWLNDEVENEDYGF